MRLAVLAILFATLATVLAWAQNKTYEDLKQVPGFTQKIQMGSVKPINNAEYIATSEAEIPDNAWVIGVVHDGKARAYSMNLLFNHNVVNEAGYSLFWDPIGNVASVYERKVDGVDLTFMASGGVLHGAMVFLDKETQSFWAGLNGRALVGPHEGKTLTRMPIAQKTIFGDWKKRHPDTTVMAIQGQNHTDRNPLQGFVLAKQPFEPPVKENKAFPAKMPTYTFYQDGKPYGITFSSIGIGWAGKAGSSKVFVWRPGKAHPYLGTFAWDIGKIKLKEKNGVWRDKKLGELNPVTGKFADGTQLSPIAGVDTYWYVWTNSEPKAKALNPPRRTRSEFKTEERGLGADDPFARQ